MKTKQPLLVTHTRKLLLVMVSTLFIQISRGQDSLNFKHGIYKVIVGTSSDNQISVGYLSSISDTSVYLSPAAVSFKGYADNNAGPKAYRYNDISEVRLRRTGSTARGILIGAVAGAITGAIVGFTSGDDYNKNRNCWCIFCLSAGEKAALAGFGLGLTGSLIGGIVGAVAHKTFIINSKKEKFDELKWSLMH